ncbi:DUF5819 family protein [Streptomyces seoulensis]|uniref:DUF5819 family protein n=1 Tax=Streptomyces seoulensis TaxID=73044 RepID=UPI001FCA63ED|nr:DUF5819 family protein [Streptomyces seoulensis]BDH02808.1 hypothetical protein HEK131_00350 [Streptomyces seoulensis]
MDAYDEDSKAPEGPDGSDGARRAGALDGPGAPPGDRGDAAAGDPAELPVPEAAPAVGLAALSPRYRLVAGGGLAVVAAVAAVHLGMVFLSLAPANTVTKRHGEAVQAWVYPEFEQNWKLFAPNPLQQNVAVQVRAQVRAEDGDLRTTGWTDLSAQDGAAIDGNLLPSHTQQNELRRAWDFLGTTHGTDNRPVGVRGALSEQYVRRIVLLRLRRDEEIGRAGTVERVQVRSRTVNVPPPEWSREKVSTDPVFRVLPWWTVTGDETEAGAR